MTTMMLYLIAFTIDLADYSVAKTMWMSHDAESEEKNKVF